MWIERVLSEVQGRRPVIVRYGHQQGSFMCESEFSGLGESGTNHLRAVR